MISFAFSDDLTQAARGIGPAAPAGRFGKFTGIGKGLQKATGKMGGAGAGGALMMGSMLPMMMADDQGKIAGKVDSSVVMSGMMVAGMFQTMIPMLSGLSAGLLGLIGVVGGVAAALGLAAFAVYKWRDGVDKAARAAAEAGSELATFGNSLSAMNKVIGAESLSEQAARRQEGLRPEEVEKAEQFASQLESEEGQAMISELQELNAQQRANRMSSYTRQAVQSGMMTSEDAQIFARELGRAVGDEGAGMAAAQAAAKATEGSAEMLQDAAKESSKILSNASVKATAEGDRVGYGDASRAIGAATAGLASYNEVIAKAELEYLDGIISYEEYIATLNKAEAAQSEYNDVILNAIRNTSDPGATAQAIKAQATNVVGKEEVDKISDSLDVETYKFMGADEFSQNYYNQIASNDAGLKQLDMSGDQLRNEYLRLQNSDPGMLTEREKQILKHMKGSMKKQNKQKKQQKTCMELWKPLHILGRHRERM